MYDVKTGQTGYLLLRFFDQLGVPMTGVSYTTVSASLWRGDNTAANIPIASGADFFEITFGDFANSGTYALRIQGAQLTVQGPVLYAVSTSAVGAKKHVGVLNETNFITEDVMNRLGAPAGASVSADIAAINTQSSTIIADVADVQTAVDAMQVDVDALTAAVANVDGDVAAVATAVSGVQTTANTISTKIGTPAGASVSADIASVKSDTTSISSSVSTISGTVSTMATDLALLLKLETGRWKIFTTGPNANKMIFYDVDETTPLLTFDLKDSAGTPTSTEPFERVPA